MTSFLRFVAKEIEENRVYGPRPAEILRRLEKARLEPKSEFFGQIFKTRTVAAIADVAFGIQHSKDFLDEKFPGNRGRFSRPDVIDISDIRSYLGIAPKAFEYASAQANSHSPTIDVSKLPHRPEIVDRLGSQRLIDLRLSAPVLNFGKINSDMDEYFRKLTLNVNKARREDLNGALILLDELKRTDFAERLYVCKIDHRGRVKIYFPGERGYSSSDTYYEVVHDLIARLEARIVDKKWGNEVEDNFMS